MSLLPCAISEQDLADPTDRGLDDRKRAEQARPRRERRVTNKPDTEIDTADMFDVQPGLRCSRLLRDTDQFGAVDCSTSSFVIAGDRDRRPEPDPTVRRNLSRRLASFWPLRQHNTSR